LELEYLVHDDKSGLRHITRLWYRQHRNYLVYMEYNLLVKTS
jgi:hypothetical protein